MLKYAEKWKYRGIVEVDKNNISSILSIYCFDTWIGWLWYYKFVFKTVEVIQ